MAGKKRKSASGKNVPARQQDGPETRSGGKDLRAFRTGPKDKLVFPDRKANPVRIHNTEHSVPPGEISGENRKADSLEEVSRHYRLNTRAIDDLVTANEENSPAVSKAELRKYRAGPKIRVADWAKALLLKWWAGGMICYFFIWGLSTFAMNQWDQIAVLGIALGLVTNLIVNSIYRFIAREQGDYDRWMMFPGKKIWFLPLDILYAMLPVSCTVLTYGAVNRLFAGPETTGPALGVEPILFGVILTLWDLLFLGMKHLGKSILKDARKQ